MRRFFQILVTSALVLGYAASAQAFLGDLFTKSKDIDIDARTRNIYTEASANRALAEAHVGSVMAGSRLEGDVKIKTRSRDITTKATANRATAVSNVGTVGAVSGRNR